MRVAYIEFLDKYGKLKPFFFSFSFRRVSNHFVENVSEGDIGITPNYYGGMMVKKLRTTGVTLH